MNKNRKRCSLAAIIALAAVLSIAFITILLLLFGNRKEKPQSVQEEESISECMEKSSEENIESEENDTAEVVKIVYDPPEYNFRLDEITVEIEGLTESYVIAFVNDLHMITDKEPGDVLEENLPRAMERYETFSVTPEGIHAETLWPEIIEFLNFHSFDAVIFAGDMLDYGSHSNMEALSEGFEALKYPKEQIMYIRSDHDYVGWYGGSVFTDADGEQLQSELWDGDDGMACIEFEEFRIVGINRSYQDVSEERLSFLLKKLEGDKPVILVTHVPFYSEEDESLEQLSMEVRNKIYYWSRESSSYYPNEETQKLIDCMYDEDTSVVQILAAHLHASWDGIVANDLKEHIFAPAFEGRIGIVHVEKPSGESKPNSSPEPGQKSISKTGAEKSSK